MITPGLPAPELSTINAMEDEKIASLERKFESTERDLRARLESFERSVGQMTASMSDIRDALIGDLSENSGGLIPSHRQLKTDVLKMAVDIEKRFDFMDKRFNAVEKSNEDNKAFRFKVVGGLVAFNAALGFILWLLNKL